MITDTEIDHVIVYAKRRAVEMRRVAGGAKDTAERRRARRFFKLLALLEEYKADWSRGWKRK